MTWVGPTPLIPYPANPLPKVLYNSVQSAIIFEYFEGFSEYVIFHGITIWQEYMPLKIKDKNGLLIIEWE
jgi:hypothetical protein